MLAGTEKLALELETFERHRLELVAGQSGRFALVKATDLVGIYDTMADAVNEGYRRFGNVPFLVKQIVAVEVPTFVVSNQLAI